MHSLLPLLLHRSCHFALDVPEPSLLPDALSLSHGDASARVLALLNAAGQAGGFLFQVGAAYLFSIGYGWSEVLGGLAGCATLATLCTALAEMSAER